MTTVTKAGRYEITGELGRGAMGVVYRASDPVIGRTVAVKAIRLSSEGTGLSRAELLTRFQTEARAAGLLTHPNIVVVYDAGEEDGLYYITMELVEGKSLQSLLDEGQAFTLPRVLRITEQACSALQFAHERNVVHRDIKPANIMLTADDTVKITDFGTAKIMQFGTVQQTAHVMGTPSYMSPEQVKGRAVDGRSDIFSLGVMLYEMVSGEKPFPGQNITTVIYKIVNEQPVPPKQVDPSIHAGISAVIMRALAKDPDSRYQSCREMLEDLHNYRALANVAGDPNSTMGLGAQGVNATMTLTPGLRGMHSDDSVIASTARSLDSRATGPMQTPGLRRTGAIQPLPEAKRKKSVIGSILAAMFLLGVIGYCGYKLLPVYYAIRQQNRSGIAQASGETQRGSAAQPADAANADATQPAEGQTPDTADKAKPGEADGTAADAAEAAPSEPPVQKTPPKAALTAKAAEYKGRIEEALDEKGLSGRVRVQGVNNTLVLAGKLHPAEHGALLKFLRDAPSEVHLVDHLEYDDAPVPSVGGSNDGGHPVPGPGYGAIHIVTDVIGATAFLHGPSGRVINQCITPCNFNNLVPQRYSLEVKKDGYQPVQTALQVRTGAVSDQKIAMEALIKGLLVTSQPSGADVFINGAKQSGQTPVNLPLAPGQYNLVLRLQGYNPYVGSVQVKDNVQTQLDTKLVERSNSRVAFADVHSNPAGAEIFIDGNSTGQFTPSRVEVPTGMHTIVLRLNGYGPAKRTVQTSEGGTVTVQESLRPK